MTGPSVALVLDQLLRDPAALAAAARVYVPVAERDQHAAVARALDARLRHAADPAAGHRHHRFPVADVPEWVRLGLLTTLVEWADGRGRTCTHAPHPRRPEAVLTAAWRPGVVVCVRCPHLLALPTGTDADRRCDGCGHHTTGPDHGDGIWPVTLAVGSALYLTGVCDRCRWWTP